jgi:hypothetical protein
MNFTDWPHDPLKYFSWMVYIVSVIVYTGFVFRGEFYKKKRIIFSKQNARPFPEIGMIHLVFLTLLYGFNRIAPYIYPSLPIWMTETFYLHGSRTSAFEFSYMFLMAGMVLYERPWLYVQQEQPQIPVG